MTIIRVVDLETGGLDPDRHGVCEVGWADVAAIGTKSWLVTGWDSILLNPGHPIAPEACAVHHIVDADVNGAQPWRDFCESWLLQEKADGEFTFDTLAAHNANFERGWLTDDLTGGVPWICTYRCALRLWPEAPAHTNQTLRYFLKPDGLKRDVADRAHRAMPDAYVTAYLLMEMLAKASVEQLVKWSSEPALQFRCQFGKHRGTPWREIDDGFLQWVLTKDFDEDVVHTVRHEIARRKRERAA